MSYEQFTIQTDVQKDMALLTWLVKLIKRKYIYDIDRSELLKANKFGGNISTIVRESRLF